MFGDVGVRGCLSSSFVIMPAADRSFFLRFVKRFFTFFKHSNFLARLLKSL